MKSLVAKIGALVSSITISLIMSGCLGGGTSGVPYYTISTEFSEYCWYKQGSYWIYQNDSTLLSDTISISEVLESKRFNPENIDYNYQAVEMFTNENIFLVSKIELTAGDTVQLPGKMNSLMRIYYTDGHYQLIFSPEYPIGEEVILGEQLGVYTNVEVIANLAVNGNTYNDVWHTRIVINATNSEYNFYIARGKGLVKSVMNTDGITQSLSVLSSNLIPK